MNRKRARHLWLELSRRIYLDNYGTLKGFGKIAKHYRDEYRHTDYSKTGGYKAGWENDIVKQLRDYYNM